MVKFFDSPMFKIYRISVTSDGWTSLTGDPYLSLTAHFITKDWHLTTKCMTTMYAPESHTAEYISDFVKETLGDYGLRTGNVVSITTDSAANMVAAARKLGKYRYFSRHHQTLMLYYIVFCAHLRLF